MWNIRGVLWVAAALGSAAGCSASKPNAPHKLACAGQRQLARSYINDVPDGGLETAASVEVPHLAVNEIYLYYLLNYHIDSVQQGLPRPPRSMPPANMPATWTTLLGRVPLSGGERPVQVRLHDGIAPAPAVIADDNASFVAEAPSTEGANGSLVRIRNGETAAETLAEAAGQITALTLSDDAIFISDAEGIQRLPLEGMTTIARISSLAPVSGLVVVDDELYASVTDSGIFHIDPKSGSTTLFDSDPAVRAVHKCGSAVCWISGSALDSQVIRKTLAGDRRVLAQGLAEPHSLAADERNVFVTVGSFGLSLIRLPLNGGANMLIPSSGATEVSTNDECIYWSTLNAIYGQSLTSVDVARAEK